MNRISKQLVKIANEINRTSLDEQGDGSGFQSLHDHYNFEQNQLDAAEKAGKKYILHKEKNFWRIQACKNFGYVKKGDFGGVIESEKNLSHEGNCCVYNSSQVYDNDTIVGGNAKVYDNDAKVGGNAKVSDKAKVGDRAVVYGKAQVYGKAEVDYRVSEGKITE